MDYQLIQSIDDAVGHLLGQLSLAEKVRIARMSKERLTELAYSVETGLQREWRREVGEDSWRDLYDCLLAKEEGKSEDASLAILEKAWQELRQSHRLRRVK